MKNNYSNDLSEENKLFIRNLFFKEKKPNLNINELIELYNNNLKDISKFKNKRNNIKDKINNYDYSTAEEYSIENILKIYKSQFDEKLKYIMD